MICELFNNWLYINELQNTIFRILNYDNLVPEEVTLEDKPDFEKLHLINQLDDEDRQTVFKIIDTMLTKKKFKDFFNKNIATM